MLFRSSKSSGSKKVLEASAGSGDSEVARGSAGSKASTGSELAENSREFWNLATAGEKQALADYVARLLPSHSLSSKTKLLESEISENYKNLIQMLTRLPLMGEDVRRIFKLIKDASSEKSERSERPRMPNEPPPFSTACLVPLRRTMRPSSEANTAIRCSSVLEWERSLMRTASTAIGRRFQMAYAIS